MTKNKEKEKLKPPSEEFKKAVLHTSSIAIDCELCGRTYFYGDPNQDWEGGEYEDLVKQHKENPDKYVCWYDDYIGWGIIDGKQAVIDCECNGLRKYEDWILGHRFVISAFLRARAERKIKDAEFEADIAEHMDEVTDASPRPRSIDL